VGTEIAVSEWMTIDQDRIGLFAEATDDHQWIHVDPVRAAGGPFRQHRGPRFPDPRADPRARQQAYRIEGVSMA